MSIQNDLVADFMVFARSQFGEHKEKLIKKYKKKDEAAGKALNLQVFNEQLESLKRILNKRIAELSIGVSDPKLKMRLEDEYHQTVNAFLKDNFYTD